MSVVENIFRQVDTDGSNYIDRCEHAHFLKGIGNTDMYAENFSSAGSLPMFKKYCSYVVIDAFDEPDTTDKGLFTTILQMAQGVLPSGLLCHGDDCDLSWLDCATGVGAADCVTEGLKMRPMSLK